MIRSVHFSNLKAFKGHHDVPLGPLTFIYGRNSAGKSSLLQALLLLKQTIESSDPERPALVIRGPLADLGSVPGIIFGHDTSLELRLGVETDVDNTFGRVADGTQRVTLSFEWDDEVRSVRQTGIDVGVDGKNIASYKRRRGPRELTPRATRTETPFRIGRRQAKEEFFRWGIERSLQGRFSIRGDDLARSILDSELDTVIGDLSARATLASGSWGILPYGPKFSLKSNSDSKRDEALKAIVKELEASWWDFLYELRFGLSNALDSVIYLGPLRRAPERFHILSGAQRRSVGREGEYMAELLNQHRDVETLVNTWLERLNIPYNLSAVDFEEAEVAHTIGDVVVLALTDVRNNLLVSPGDVGFGISQLLPIVVQAFAGQETTVCVEQPEIHVHPRLQGSMADLFIAAALEGPKNQFVIETHSEHLMLRIQRRVRAGDIKPDDVKVLYVDTDAEGAARVLELRLDENGRFIDEWPEGFFEERFDEIFGTE